MVLPNAKVTVVPDEIDIEAWYPKLDVPVMVAVPLPLNIMPIAAPDGCAMFNPAVIVRDGVVPVKLMVIPETPKLVD